LVYKRATVFKRGPSLDSFEHDYTSIHKAIVIFLDALASNTRASGTFSLLRKTSERWNPGAVGRTRSAMI
jgi:hypothetical protein